MVNLMRPLPGAPHITQVYGPTSFQAEPPAFGYPHFHLGVDYGAACGTVVYAPDAGIITKVGWDDTGFGLVVQIDHAGGYRSLLCHLREALVCKGQHVLQHAPVGEVGTTGNSTGCHLHWSVLLDGQYVSPAAHSDLRIW